MSTLQSTFPDRILTLSDGRSGLRGSIHVDIRQPVPSPGGEGQGEGGTAVLDFVSSDATLDRYHEIISPAGWNLAAYQKNPVFQNAHQYGDIIFTLGKALVTEVRRSADASSASPYLFQRIEFAVAANPMAKIAHALYSGKFLNTVSVGFIPVRWEDGTAQSGYTRKYLEQELLEVSAVAIPANPNALALALKSGAVEKSDLKETADLLRQITANGSPSPRGEGRGEGELRPTPVHPLLALARELRDLLKKV
jgi:hypothetical protein